jgi:hypothetical protein
VRTCRDRDSLWQTEPTSKRFPSWRTACLAATPLAATCEKSLFMGPRLNRVLSCSGNEGMLPSLCNCFSSAYSARYRPINVPNWPSCSRSSRRLRSFSNPPLRLTRHSAKCYKSTFCVRPCLGPTGAAPPRFSAADRLGARSGSSGPTGVTQKTSSCPVLWWEPFELRQGHPPALNMQRSDDMVCRKRVCRAAVDPESDFSSWRIFNAHLACECLVPGK